MGQRRLTGKKLWWTSAGAVVVVGGVLAGTMFANAAGPALPAKTPAQLLADIQRAKPPAAFSAVVTENANLGFPSLPDIGGLSSSTLSAANWISGTHTVDIWYAGPGHVRVAVPVSFGETDLRVNGSDVWLWDSHSQTATHYELSAEPRPGLRLFAPGALAGAKRGIVRTCLLPFRKATAKGILKPVPKSVRLQVRKCLEKVQVPAPGQVRVVPATPMTPQQVAERLLSAVGPTTNVTVPGTTTVAGRPAYQLDVSPRTDQSLIGRIEIDVDSSTYLPLQVQVFPRGSGSSALTVGFTSLSFATPASSNFTFTPPAGAHVKTVKLSAAGLSAAGPEVQRVAVPRAVHPVKLHNGHQVHVVLPASPLPAMVPAMPGNGASLGSGVQVLGQGWLSVAVLPSVTSMSAQSAKINGALSTGQSAYGSSFTMVHTAGVPGPGAGELGALLRVLLNAAKPVHGSWGSGRLLQTTLVNALITSNGKVLIGAVTPAVLYADAAKVK